MKHLFNPFSLPDSESIYFPSLIRCALFLLVGMQSTSVMAQCCTYRLQLQDNYGDGWNGATLEVLVNGASVGVYRAVDAGSAVELAVCNGDALELVYTAGEYENENAYSLTDAAWNTLFRDGPDPETGAVFSVVADCDAPLRPGSHPCTAIGLDSLWCVPVDNTGLVGSGWVPNCSWYQGGDIWYKVAVPPSGNLGLETMAGSIDDTGIAVWTGDACTGLQIVGCDDDEGDGYLSLLQVYDLTPGDTVYVQAWQWGGGNGTFELCLADLGTITLDSSELPIVMINTLGQTIVEDTKIACLMDIKYNGPGNITYTTDNANVYSGNIGIEIRGASSASYPQRPYGIETRDAQGENRNVSILGMPSENDWVLLSNYNDRSLVKNLTAFKLFREMGNYSVRAQLCEVLIDGAYKGIYLIGEKIKRDNNRVDIANLMPSETEGDDLTGGYILQQNYWDESNSFQSNYSPIDHPELDVHFVYEYPEPEVIHPAQKAYIAAYVDSLETALYSSGFGNPTTGYRQYMDVKSFIDYFLVNEVSRNADGFKKSVFFHKDKHSNGGKLKAGPVWDFDWAWKNLGGVCYLYEGYTGAGWAHLNNDCPTDNNSTGWYVRLLQDSTFRNELRCTYDEYRQTILDTAYLFAYIDNMGAQVQNAQARHFQRWLLLGRSGSAPDYGDVATTYYAELDSLKSWIGIRLQWLDANMPGQCTPTSTTEASLPDRLVCYPNPAQQYLGIDYFVASTMPVSVRLYHASGAEALHTHVGTQPAGSHSAQLDTRALPAGVYYLTLERGGQTTSQKVVLMRE